MVKRSAREDIQTTEILILAEASSVNTVVSGLESSDLQFNWHQATHLSEDELTAKIDIVLYDANSDASSDANSQGLTLDKAIAFFSVSKLLIPVLVINGEPKISAAVAAIKAGAIDYLTEESRSQLPQAIAKAISQPDYACLQSLCEAQVEQQLQKLIVENADGIIVVDERGIVQFVNPAALKLLGKSSAQLVGEALGFPVVNGDYLEVDSTY